MLSLPPSVTPLMMLWQGLFGPAVIWILLMALAIPIVAFLVRPMTLRMEQSEREKARRMYERIVIEKLDVIKTAVAMGHSQNELAELDARLEKLIGAEELISLLDEKGPSPPAVPVDSELRDTDLGGELQHLQPSKPERTEDEQ
jgi:uncharacterized membrane protein YcjF (UPF0283 family)